MKALVLGAAGQDGRLLTATLRKRGYSALGIDRTSGPDIEACDITDAAALRFVLEASAPQLIFHLAALHGHAGTTFEAVWPAMLAVNVTSLHTVLEYQRTAAPQVRLIYASSARAFGENPPTRIDDDTPMKPTCLYGLSKQAGSGAVDYYRRKHGVRAAALHFFNHESELRQPDFFIPRLLKALAGAVADREHRSQLRTLEFYCDWGSAAEYMEIAAALAERDLLDVDYVVARQKCVHARALAEFLFAHFGLDYRNHIIETSQGPIGARPYAVTCRNLREKLGTSPQIDIQDLCLHILKHSFGLVPS